MRTRRSIMMIGFVFVWALPSSAQNWATNPLGDWFLNQTPPAPRSVTLGDGSVLNLSSLNVRGDQMPVFSPQFPGLCTFRTDVAQVTEQGWEMWRDLNHIGRIWHPGQHRSFHVQSTEPRDDGQDRYSGVFIQNSDDDGLWVIHDGPPTGGRTFPNALQLIDRTGYAALGWSNSYLFTGTDPRGPWSRLHLFHEVQGSRPLFAFRSQMQNGLTMSGNSDLAYVGQWYDRGTNGTGAEVDDNSNLVIATSENNLPVGDGHDWDNISFRFMGDLSQPTTGSASSVDGLEMVRISPFRETANDAIEGFVGIGDFLGSSAQPEERLDLLDRTIRLRDFSPLLNTSFRNQGVTVNRVLVADETDGTVYWRPMGDFTGTPVTDCDWDQQTAGSLNVRTAYPGAPLGCPNDGSSVGIGTATPNAKLEVVNHMAQTNNGSGLQVRLFPDGHNNNTIGVSTEVSPNPNTGWTQFGLQSKVFDARYLQYGADLHAEINDASINAYRSYGLRSTNWIKNGSLGNAGFGIYTISRADAPATVGANYGIYSAAIGGTTTWAGYFPGSVYAITYVGSDASLKTNVQDLQGALPIVDQLAPKTYEYLSADNPTMQLSDQPQIGLIAQDVEQVLPHLVKEAVQPEELDSLGNVIHPAVSFKALNYEGIVPVLIGAIKEQQAIIDQQDQRLDQMEQQLSACCIDMGDLDNRSQLNGNDGAEGENSLSIRPNPFQGRTVIEYELRQAGQIRLVMTDGAGKQLRTLQEGWHDAGRSTYEWMTQDLPSGTYYVSLLVDDQLEVMKAMKME